MTSKKKKRVTTSDNIRMFKDDWTKNCTFISSALKKKKTCPIFFHHHHDVMLVL